MNISYAPGRIILINHNGKSLPIEYRLYILMGNMDAVAVGRFLACLYPSRSEQDREAIDELCKDLPALSDLIQCNLHGY
jgi:hypothetical protein